MNDDQARPWEQPGFRFYTPAMRAWLGGYEPVLAPAICADRIAQGAAKAATANTELRMAGKKGGWGAGTIHGGLSNNSDPAKAGRMRKASKL